MSKNDLGEDQAYLPRKAEVNCLCQPRTTLVEGIKEERLFLISDAKTADNIRASRL